MLWIPEAVVGHLIGRVGCSLKLAATISKAHIAVAGLSTEPGAARKAMIHGTTKEVGMALVVMGK
jgi:cell division ATPase FtsA